ncbi:MAG: hypothetical protein ACD_79C01270G0006 [uncultured bacterium]|nr:MAG: hypothetical protein ACD_79C01270G0006 [uncultured bacterium]
MWKLIRAEKFNRRLKEYSKNHPDEVLCVLDNLNKYFFMLENGVKPRLISMGCIHIEPKGIIALDQKGSKGKLKQTRLYIYPDEEKEILYVMTLGDKHSQSDDIKECIKFVDDIRKGIIYE